jgi:Domain of Unknown Function (DUF1080)
MKISIVIIAGLVLQCGALLAQEEGFTSMFNGQDLTGWGGETELWSVQDGAIVGETSAEHPAKQNTFLVWTNGEPADFEMRCSFKIEAKNGDGFANSGIQYRSRFFDRSYWVITGYQADMEAGPNYTGGLYEEKGRGIMAKRGETVIVHADGSKEVTGSIGSAEELEGLIHKGGWNEYLVIARGNHLQQFINGREMIDLVDEQKNKAATSGLIALQLHAGKPMRVEFKNLRIKTLD